MVDVVALDGEGGLLVGECKWGRADAPDLDRLIRRGKLIAAEATDIGHVTPVLFTAGGLGDEVRARIESGEAVHVPVAALYETDDPRL